MSKVVAFLVWFILRDVCQTRRHDICSAPYLRFFSEPGETGVLTASHVSAARGGEDNATLLEGCQVEVVACSSCVLVLTFRYMNLGCRCGSCLNLLFHNPCGCEYVWITEPPHANSGRSFCGVVTEPGGDVGYESETRVVRISFLYKRSHGHAFTLEYKSAANRRFFFGTPDDLPSSNSSANFISSPFFPSAYPRDLGAEYVLGCRGHSDRRSVAAAVAGHGCRVRLAFTDFQLAASSRLEFYDGERRLGTVTGASFRPPAVTTSTPSLRVLFFAGGSSNLGFKALFSFLSDESAEKSREPVTDCGGRVDDFGGTIKMIHTGDAETKLYDCIWLLQPQRNLLSFKSHLYLKVTTFSNFDGNARLHVRQGLTSESPVLEELGRSAPPAFKEHVLPLRSGYYVSLKALFGPGSHLAIAYASFSYNRCFILSEFLCQNRRCISKELTCDGFDHCGDKSDEPPGCYPEREKGQAVGRWRTRTPNHYSLAWKGYPDPKTASAVFLLSLVGLVFFIAALTSIVCRTAGWRSQRPQERDLQDHLHSISEFLDSLEDEASMEEIVADDPPSYEPPPNYEDVIRNKAAPGTHESGLRSAEEES